ncbi:peptidase [Massilia sp. CCM 9210]|uniref:PA domain-containing protein n=1 Tax=Massilia scottii TaxID=3057166 RepID=UPI00279694F3|nr:PA domain-containing protein [Massilia sp. CCM 9210]MDQ1813333.1 peptidase [Massilia sp. CCM 9210]
MSNKRPLLRRAAAALAVFCCTIGSAHAAATITIVNTNGPNVGFNDPTPVQPVGGNSGRTLGAQRLIAFQQAADIWGRTLTSPVPVRVAASFEPLPCNADGAVLGAAGAVEVFSNFPNAPKADTWYPGALASKLARTDLATPGQAHIQARFNSRLGLFPDCMPGSGFYLGLDRKAGAQIDLVTVLLHELAHGLGFQNFTDESTGEFFLGTPSIWDYFLVDIRNNKTWVNMKNDERRLSAIGGANLSWNGERVYKVTAEVLAPQPQLLVSGMAAGKASGSHEVGDAAFGPQLGQNAVTGELMPVVDQPNGGGLACTPLSPANAMAVRGNIALVDRGACTFVTKARILQNAGARGMVVMENTADPVSPLGGTDPAVRIPAVRIDRATGNQLKSVMVRRSRTSSGVTASLGVDPDRLSGTDLVRRIRMYSPEVFSPGSSVSHYSVDTRPNQLMEPSISADLLHDVNPPRDLTYPLLQDIGW